MHYPNTINYKIKSFGKGKENIDAKISEYYSRK
jgi:hypothetical protein